MQKNIIYIIFYFLFLGKEDEIQLSSITSLITLICLLDLSALFVNIRLISIIFYIGSYPCEETWKAGGFRRNSAPIKRVMFGRPDRTLEAQLASFAYSLLAHARGRVDRKNGLVITDAARSGIPGYISGTKREGLLPIRKSDA